jgi:hypothetical protein
MDDAAVSQVTHALQDDAPPPQVNCPNSRNRSPI